MLSRILRTEQGANTLIALNLPGGAGARVLVKEYQLDPVTHELLHADFYRVAMDKVLRVQVTVVAQGEPKGVKQQGGILDIVNRQIEIECLPADIPNHIEIDVSELMVGQSVRVKDVATNPKWKTLSDAEMMILHVIIPKVEEAPAPADEAAAAAAAPAAPAEPELIKKGKKEEAEGAEPAAASAAAKKEKK
jgi:large subunit ribosomal protein L25